MASSESTQTERDVESEIKTFLRANFPQIEMHGGEISITEVDPENSHAAINLAGACSGCGISPMTVQAVKKRLPNEIAEINTVDVSTEPEEEDNITDGPF